MGKKKFSENDPEPWQDNPHSDDWLYKEDPDVEPDSADSWKKKALPLNSSEPCQAGHVNLPPLPADDQDLYTPLDEIFTTCRMCRRIEDELSEGGEVMEWWFEHLCEHENKEWRKLGKPGRQKWIDFALKEQLTMDGYNLFSDAFHRAVRRGEAPPKEPQEALDRFILDTEALPRDGGESARTRQEISKAWRRLKPSQKMLWNELQRRFYIKEQIYIFTPEDMEEVKLRHRQGNGSLLFRLCFYAAQKKGISVPAHPRDAYKAGLFTDHYNTLYEPLLDHLEHLNDNSWAVEFQKRSNITPHNVRRPQELKDRLRMLKQQRRSTRRQMKKVQDSMEEEKDYLRDLKQDLRDIESECHHLQSELGYLERRRRKEPHAGEPSSPQPPTATNDETRNTA